MKWSKEKRLILWNSLFLAFQPSIKRTTGKISFFGIRSRTIPNALISDKCKLNQNLVSGDDESQMMNSKEREMQIQTQIQLQFSFIIQIQLLEGDELERNPWVSAWGAHFRARHKDHSQVRMVITIFFMIMMMLKTKMMIVTRFCNEMDHRIRNLEDIQTIPWFKVSLAHKYTFSLHIFIGHHSHVSYHHASFETTGLTKIPGGWLVAHSRETSSHSCWGERKQSDKEFLYSRTRKVLWFRQYWMTFELERNIVKEKEWNRKQQHNLDF